tara:strand:+ start:141 stop:707 length:567 start_codon:yes stop_codon:yes gene_type:complete
MNHIKTYEGFMDIFKSKKDKQDKQDIGKKEKEIEFKSSDGSPRGGNPNNFVVIIKDSKLKDSESKKISKILNKNPNSSWCVVDESKCKIDYNNKKVLVSDSHLVYKIESISDDTLIYFITYDDDLKDNQLIKLDNDNIKYNSNVVLDKESVSKNNTINILVLKDIGDLPKGNDKLHFYFNKKAINTSW